MQADSFIIDEFRGVMRVHDPRGRYLLMKSRHCAVIIITLSGKIRFTQNGRIYVSDSTHPIFIPEGASYVNECEEEADSLMFSFRTTQHYESIKTLTPIPASECLWYYDMIRETEVSKKNTYKQKQLSLVYSMLDRMLAVPDKKESVSARAAALIRKNYPSASFNCKTIASNLYISEAYLRREFKKEYKMSIGAYLKKTRMEKARELLLEKRSVSETALSCGYSEVYQFSRAYKKYYGDLPSRLPEGE